MITSQYVFVNRNMSRRRERSRSAGSVGRNENTFNFLEDMPPDITGDLTTLGFHFRGGNLPMPTDLNLNFESSLRPPPPTQLPQPAPVRRESSPANPDAGDLAALSFQLPGGHRQQRRPSVAAPTLSPGVMNLNLELPGSPSLPPPATLKVTPQSPVAPPPEERTTLQLEYDLRGLGVDPELIAGCCNVVCPTPFRPKDPREEGIQEEGSKLRDTCPQCIESEPKAAGSTVSPRPATPPVPKILAETAMKNAEESDSSSSSSSESPSPTLQTKSSQTEASINENVEEPSPKSTDVSPPPVPEKQESLLPVPIKAPSAASSTKSRSSVPNQSIKSSSRSLGPRHPDFSEGSPEQVTDHAGVGGSTLPLAKIPEDDVLPSPSPESAVASLTGKRQHLPSPIKAQKSYSTPIQPLHFAYSRSGKGVQGTFVISSNRECSQRMTDTEGVSNYESDASPTPRSGTSPEAQIPAKPLPKTQVQVISPRITEVQLSQQSESGAISQPQYRQAPEFDQMTKLNLELSRMNAQLARESRSPSRPTEMDDQSYYREGIQRIENMLQETIRSLQQSFVPPPPTMYGQGQYMGHFGGVERGRSPGFIYSPPRDMLDSDGNFADSYQRRSSGNQHSAGLQQVESNAYYGPPNTPYSDGSFGSSGSMRSSEEPDIPRIEEPSITGLFGQTFKSRLRFQNDGYPAPVSESRTESIQDTTPPAMNTPQKPSTTIPPPDNQGNRTFAFESGANSRKSAPAMAPKLNLVETVPERSLIKDNPGRHNIAPGVVPERERPAPAPLQPDRDPRYCYGPNEAFNYNYSSRFGYGVPESYLLSTNQGSPQGVNVNDMRWPQGLNENDARPRSRPGSAGASIGAGHGVIPPQYWQHDQIDTMMPRYSLPAYRMNGQESYGYTPTPRRTPTNVYPNGNTDYPKSEIRRNRNMQ